MAEKKWVTMSNWGYFTPISGVIFFTLLITGSGKCTLYVENGCQPTYKVTWWSLWWKPFRWSNASTGVFFLPVRFCVVLKLWGHMLSFFFQSWRGDLFVFGLDWFYHFKMKLIRFWFQIILHAFLLIFFSCDFTRNISWLLGLSPDMSSRISFQMAFLAGAQISLSTSRADDGRRSRSRHG